MTFSACARPSIVAFCVLNDRTRLPVSFSRRARVSPAQHSNTDLPLGDARASPSPTPSSEGEDWFAVGRDAARQLRLDLGIAGGDAPEREEEEEAPSLSPAKRKQLGGEKNTSARSDAMESGRAAALELLRDMNSDNETQAQGGGPSEGGNQKRENSIQPSLTSASNTGSDSLQSNSKIAPDQQQPSVTNPQSSSTTANDTFDRLSRKSHCMTVCLVPHPSSATQAWEQLTAARRTCQDPGFFRWPPHATLLYPFLEPAASRNKGEDTGGEHARFRADLTLRLKKATERCEPFDVTLESFGTFGGEQRGVLWAYPKSSREHGAGGEEEVTTEEEPLIRLHRLLEEQFPMCRDPHKSTAAFHPHMTLSHYENNNLAVAAMTEVQSRWTPVTFHVPEVYLLERRGDRGQFKIAATLPLGAGAEERVEFHDPPVAFPAMAKEEEDWVHEARLAMKERRKKGFRKRRKRRGGRSKEGGASQGSPRETSS